MRNTSNATSRDGTRIAWDLVGDGPPLVLIEPAGHFRKLSAFADLVPRLTARFRVCQYDRRGRGESGDHRPYQVEREVEDLAALVDALGGSAFVYAYSSGPLLALHASARGVPLAGMVLLEPPLPAEFREDPDPLTGQLEALVERGRHEDAVALFHESIGVPPEIIESIRDTDRWSRMVEIAHTLAYDCRISDAMQPHVLESVRHPTLILSSVGSSNDLVSSVDSAINLVPGARHVALDGEWHSVDPVSVTNEIVAFITPLSRS